MVSRGDNLFLINLISRIFNSVELVLYLFVVNTYENICIHSTMVLYLCEIK